MDKYRLSEKFFEFRDLRELLRYSSKKHKDRTAFVTKIKPVAFKEIEGVKPPDEPVYINTSYEKLFHDMNCLGTALSARGYDGARVAIIGTNSYRWCLAYFTAASGLGVTVPLDAALEKAEITSCLQRSEATVIFFDKKSAPVIEEIISEGLTKLKFAISLEIDPMTLISLTDEKDAGIDSQDDSITIDGLVREGSELLENGELRYVDANIHQDAMAFLLFTSGTTQQSKAVMLSHRNLMSCIYGMCCEELFFPEDVNMQILPLHHCFGMVGLMTFLVQGMKNVFFDGLKYINKNLKEYGVTVMMSVPLILENVYRKINKAIEKQGMERKIAFALKVCSLLDKIGVDLRRWIFKPIIEQLGGKLRFFINGAAALDPAVSKGLNDFGILTVNGYGLTETSPTISSESYRYLRLGSVGKVMPNVEARIDNPDQEGIGELVVRGDNIMLGYYGDEISTKEVIKDGWLHTGDLAYFDDDDYLFITGRAKNVIVMKNGKNVFPEEIENIVNLLPYVEETMLFTREKSTDVVLWLKVVYSSSYLADKNMTMEELKKQFDKDMDRINGELPSYKRVHRYYLSDIPTIKTTTQKTKRADEMGIIERELRDRGL